MASPNGEIEKIAEEIEKAKQHFDVELVSDYCLRFTLRATGGKKIEEIKQVLQDAEYDIGALTYLTGIDPNMIRMAFSKFEVVDLKEEGEIVTIVYDLCTLRTNLGKIYTVSTYALLKCIKSGKAYNECMDYAVNIGTCISTGKAPKDCLKESGLS